MTPELSARVESLASKKRYLHWHLAFPEVFFIGGFDVVVGNPPWDVAKINQKEFFDKICPELCECRTSAERQKMLDQMPGMKGLYEAACGDAARESMFCKLSGRYPLNSNGQIDLYNIFAELSMSLIHEKGYFGIIVPIGIATNESSNIFFQYIINNKLLISLYGFENERHETIIDDNGQKTIIKSPFFPGVNSRYHFCLLTCRRTGTPYREYLPGAGGLG